MFYLRQLPAKKLKIEMSGWEVSRELTGTELISVRRIIIDSGPLTVEPVIITSFQLTQFRDTHSWKSFAEMGAEWVGF